MVFESKESKLGDNTYMVTPLGAVTGRKLLLRVMKAMGGKSLTAIAEEDFDFLCDTLATTTLVKRSDGKTFPLKDIFDSHFSTNYDEMTKWLLFALEVNYDKLFPLAVVRAKVDALLGAVSSIGTAAQATP